MSLKSVVLVTDGACLGNPGPGGWAALLRYNGAEKMLSAGEPDTTNNRMEIMAVMEGLKTLSEKVQLRIVTDSKYVMNAFVEGWVDNWQANGWRTASKKPVKNRDLWEELIDLLERHDYEFEWVKGHAGHPDNERVDQAARAAAEQQA